MSAAGCRYCGSRVEFFGAVCSGCDPDGGHWERVAAGDGDALFSLVRADADALRVGGES